MGGNVTDYEDFAENSSFNAVNVVISGPIPPILEVKSVRISEKSRQQDAILL